jgi:hypothetical protein
MAFFPQLTTGAAVQYPCIKRRVTRAVQNVSAEGRRTATADAGAGTAEWELRYTGLSTAERQAIEGLFAASEGRLSTFGFLDPMDNLLAYSEQFDESVWSRDPLLEVSGGFVDPRGGTSAFRLLNSGQAPQGLRQAVAGPATFYYCLSVWVRGTGTVTLRMSSASTSAGQAVRLETAWRRRYFGGSPGVDESPVTFGIEVAPGGSVDVFGAQVDAQWGPSAYRRTLARGGVYGSARFDQDELAVVSEAAEEHSLMVRVKATV